MMMVVASDLVDAVRLPEAHGPPLNIVRSQIPSLRRSQSFKELTASGVAGDARRATAAKGEALLAAYAGNLATKLIAGQPWGEKPR